MSSSPGNPLGNTHDGVGSKVSETVYTIAGIKCIVNGLDELPEGVEQLNILWLLHPRLQKAETMGPIGAQAISHWNQKRSQSDKDSKKGLIAIAFDQRNHGGRMVDKLSNEAWRQGNTRHAQDMFSIYQGTAQDTSLLIRHIHSYLPSSLAHTTTTHHTLGISLGGHSAWHLIVAEPRIQTAIIIIGCPDYTRLMLQRAEKSKLKTFKDGGPTDFLGSTDFPKALMEEITVADPAGMLLPISMQAPATEALKVLESNIPGVKQKLSFTLKDKNIFTLSGGADKLVPYACGEVFYDFLKDASGSWWQGNGLTFKDKIYKGVGHETTPEMAKDAVEFLGSVIAAGQIIDRARL